MILLKHIINFPSYFGSRREKLRDVVFRKITQYVGSNSITFTGTTAKSGHTTTTEVGFIDRKITLQSPIKMRCSCESFTYEFLFTTYKNNALLGDLPKLPSGKSLMPKKKNPHFVIGTCKHIVKLAQYIQTQRGKIY